MQISLRSLFFFTALVLLLLAPRHAHAWGKGHRLIRLWAIAHLPAWQRAWIGQPHLGRLAEDYTSLQDRHAGGRAPELDPYCKVPGVRLSLHDVNPVATSIPAMLWYLDQITDHLQADKPDEAMKYLGVLCHWNEDPGCPSAHSSPVSEQQLKILLPPPHEKQRFNYLYGYGGIADVGDYQLADVAYRPRLLGTTREEIALRLYQHQRLLERGAAAHIVPIVQDMMYGDGRRADEHRAAAATANARHVTDLLYTVFCLAADRFDEEETALLATQKLSKWLPDPGGRQRIGHPYYVTPYLVNQSMDAARRLHPLALGGTGEKQASAVEHGFGTGAPFSLDYTLAPGGVFDRFTCRVGLHPTAGPAGEISFAVAQNGEELYRTDPLRAGAPPQSIDVKLPKDTKFKLSLITIPTDPDASKQNLAVWAEPTLHRADPDRR